MKERAIPCRWLGSDRHHDWSNRDPDRSRSLQRSDSSKPASSAAAPERLARKRSGEGKPKPKPLPARLEKYPAPECSLPAVERIQKLLQKPHPASSGTGPLSDINAWVLAILRLRFNGQKLLSSPGLGCCHRHAVANRDALTTRKCNTCVWYYSANF